MDAPFPKRNAVTKQAFLGQQASLPGPQFQESFTAEYKNVLALLAEGI